VNEVELIRGVDQDSKETRQRHRRTRGQFRVSTTLLVNIRNGVPWRSKDGKLRVRFEDSLEEFLLSYLSLGST